VVRGNRAACAIGRIEPAENRFNDFFRNFEIELVAPDRSETTFPVQLEINSEQPDVYPDSNVESVLGRTFRTFYVTNASDSGAGSLRAAIETANASCNAVVPCQVAFRIPDAKGPWQTIALASPLPAVTASNLSIDASTQSKYFADTNPDGPEIELDGSQVVGHGFDIQSRCEMEVAGFAINGFPGYGIYIHTPERCVQQFSGVRRVRDNAIGTDPTGMRAIPNTRGVYIAVANETTPTVIVRNIISGNRRAGIFVEHGRMTSITRNTIGLNRTITAGLGNGASGIFLDTVSHASGISDNYIGFNAEAGVAIRAGAQYIAMGGNSFQANGGLAIDHGLDGVTEMLGFPHPNIPLPIITSARFENGETIVEGTVDTSMGSVNVYANDAPDPSGYGEGQYTLGKAEAVDRRFTFVHKGDLRGKWIAATTTARFIYQLGIDGITASTTSEFGRAVEVR
jgi:hypothetical protein